MDRWAQAMKWIFEMEGGYVNDPDDPGGETRWGISKRSYPNEDIKNLTPERAEQIYKKDYWEPCHCDELPEKWAFAIFDCAVNQGISKAKRMMQMALNVVVDGILGPKTIKAAHEANEEQLIKFLLDRAQDYYWLTEKRPNMKKFLRGWIKRLFHLSNIILEDEAERFTKEIQLIAENNSPDIQ